MIVQENLVRAFGLAGTIGLIRYRTVVREPKDTTVLLFAMVVGMAVGLGNYPVAVLGALFATIALALLKYVPLFLNGQGLSRLDNNSAGGKGTRNGPANNAAPPSDNRPTTGPRA